MNAYELLMPLITLLVGMVINILFEIFVDEETSENQWLVQLVVLLLALFQQTILYSMPPNIFARGGMALDGITQVLSISIFVIAIFNHVGNKQVFHSRRAHIDLLQLGLVFSSVFTVQANRLFFSLLGIVAMVWMSSAVLASDGKRSKQAGIVYDGIVRGIILLLISIFLLIACYSLFAETQLDEIQRILVRNTSAQSKVIGIQIIILFLASYIMGVPPFTGIFSNSRNFAGWAYSLCITSFFSVVGLGLFIRWAIFLFSRVAIGGLELEPVGPLDVFFGIKMIACGGLLLAPVIALSSKNFGRGLSFFILTPYIQALYGISFGHRDLFEWALGSVLISSFCIGLILLTVPGLNLQKNFTHWNLKGYSKIDPNRVMPLILGLAALMGLAPFYGNLFLQKTLRINSWCGIILIAHVFLNGIYVIRLAVASFQRPLHQVNISSPLTLTQKILIIGQIGLLIFMGIWWQPLYKYGSYSVRSFYGDT